MKPSALDKIEELVIEELVAVPTDDELSKAIDSLASKLLEMTASPLTSSSTARQPYYSLHELLRECWKEGTVPQGMQDANNYSHPL